MMAAKRKKHKIPKLNLIPILDAVFIFIFFLLMSAQFLDVFEIGSDAPAMKMLTKEENDKKDPLNLKLAITLEDITIYTGAAENVYKTIPIKGDNYDLDALYTELITIKSKYKNEKSVILKPTKAVSYRSIVRIIDHVRYYKEMAEDGSKPVLFDEIMFENLM